MFLNKYLSLRTNVNFCVGVTYERVLFNFQQTENIIIKNYTVIHYDFLNEWFVFYLHTIEM